jgi:hypothetical protein
MARAQTPAEAAKQKERRIRRRMIAASLFAGLLLFEIALRLFRFDFAEPPSWRYDPVLGWTQPRSLSYRADSGGLHFTVALNHAGFRDVEHTVEKPPGVKRIVVIGDSYCEALQVPLEATFWKALEARLNARGGARWEVINLGVGDFGSAQEWLALTRIGLAYHPDFVLLSFFPLNDLCNNSIELYAHCLSPNDRYRPYFVEDPDGTLRLTSAQPVRNFLRSHLRTWTLLEYAVGKLWPPARTDQADPEWLDQHLDQQNPFTDGPYNDEAHQVPMMARAWHVTVRILEKIVGEAKAAGARTITVVMPAEQEVTGINWPPTATSDYPARRITQHLQPLGVPVVSTVAEMKRQRDTVLPFIGGHPNSAGHAAVADLLYEKMVALGWTER